MSPIKGTIDMRKGKNGTYSYNPLKVLSAYAIQDNIPKQWCEIRKAELAAACSSALRLLKQLGRKKK